ncbi:MAG: division/cell wall cluster transcriptional repressor MraZ [Chloroflexota bacterium]
MFYGEFQYRVDDRGRVPLPPRFRRDLKDGLVLMAGVERCITAYSLPAWKKLSDTLATPGSVTQDKMRRLNRYLFGTAFNLLIDSQGRITLPLNLREYAGITNDVVVVGANTYLEIWNQELWEAEKIMSQEQAWQTIESLGGR